MPPRAIPADIVERLAKPNPAVVATIRPDGTPHTAATWYELRDDRLLLNMDAGRTRLAYMRANPAVAVTVIDLDDIYYAVSLFGTITELIEDDGLRDIDALSQRYFGRPYHDRVRPRWSAWVEIERWHLWDSDATR